MGNVPVQTISSILNGPSDEGHSEPVNEPVYTQHDETPDWLKTDTPSPETVDPVQKDGIEKGTPYENVAPAKESISTLGDQEIKKEGPVAPVGDGNEKIEALISNDTNTKIGDNKEREFISALTEEKKKPAHGRRVI